MIQLPDGTLALQGFSGDITERQRAEMALRASEEKFAPMLNMHRSNYS
ncbi:MAG: hypothetical protein IPL11_10980 [Candidatus Accumulibacter sp.]|nr:hypothetical protein [Accumulibacter sp.]